jgi:hypothetical protein
MGLVIRTVEDTVIPTARTFRRRLLSVPGTDRPHRPHSDTPDARPMAMGDTVPHRAGAATRVAGTDLTHERDHEDPQTRPLSASACANATAPDAATASTGPTLQQQDVPTTRNPQANPANRDPTKPSDPTHPRGHADRWIKA